MSINEREYAAARVAAFLDHWEADKAYGDVIYGLGRLVDGKPTDFRITVTDLKTLIGKESK